MVSFNPFFTVCSLKFCSLDKQKQVRKVRGATDKLYSCSAGIKSPPRDYSIPGTNISRIFTTIGAAANLVFAYNTGMLPEIQVFLKKDTIHQASLEAGKRPNKLLISG